MCQKKEIIIIIIINNYILDVAPFNIKMITSALLEFKNIYVQTVEISAKPNMKDTQLTTT